MKISPLFFPVRVLGATRASDPVVPHPTRQHNNNISDWFGSSVANHQVRFAVAPPNISFTKSPVSKPAPGRVSCESTAPLAPPPPRRHANSKKYEDFICFHVSSFPRVEHSHETNVCQGKSLVFGGELVRIVESVHRPVIRELYT